MFLRFVVFVLVGVKQPIALPRTLLQYSVVHIVGKLLLIFPMVGIALICKTCKP